MPSDRNQMLADLRTALLADAALAALVGDRITRQQAKQGAKKPHIILHHIGGEETRTHDHVETEGDEHSTLVQFDCIGLTPDSADEVCTALRTALLTIGTTTGTTFLGFQFDSPFSEAAQSVSSTNQGAETVARVIQTVTINHISTNG